MPMRNSSNTRLPSLAALSVAVAALAGCASDQLALDDTYVPYSPAERYPIQYAKKPIGLRIDASEGSMHQAQIDAVEEYARQSMDGGQAQVSLRRSSGEEAKMVADEIVEVLTGQGVPENRIRISSVGSSSDPHVHMSYNKAFIHTKPCGVWEENLADTAHNQRPTNHGCAVQSNIAAMIADPTDIIKPTPTSPATTTAAAAAIGKVQRGESTLNGTYYTNAQGNQF